MNIERKWARRNIDPEIWDPGCNGWLTFVHASWWIVLLQKQIANNWGTLWCFLSMYPRRGTLKQTILWTDGWSIFFSVLFLVQWSRTMLVSTGQTDQVTLVRRLRRHPSEPTTRFNYFGSGSLSEYSGRTSNRLVLGGVHRTLWSFLSTLSLFLRLRSPKKNRTE